MREKRSETALPLRSRRSEVQERLPGVAKILNDMRDSGDPDRLADAAFLLGWMDALADVGAEMIDRLRDAATVIERMANGAGRAECSPELDRVIDLLRRIEDE